MLDFITKLFGDPNERKISKLAPLVDEINDFESQMEALSDEELQAKTLFFKNELANRERDEDPEKDKKLEQAVLDLLLPEAFAVVREAGKRVLGMRHYDVQLIGGYVLHKGGIAEMRTGEGKTLVATLPAYLNALTGKGVHIVTVNDYLAKRDAEWDGDALSLFRLERRHGLIGTAWLWQLFGKARSLQGGYYLLEPIMSLASITCETIWPPAPLRWFSDLSTLRLLMKSIVF